jgi:Protein of unknown function (DUF2480)
MDEQQQIVNKVANSPLVTINLEDYYEAGERVLFDIKDQLYQGLLLREKDFRDFIKNHDWTQYKDKVVAITCSTEAIVPTWAYMLLTIALNPFAKKVVFGSLLDLEVELFRIALRKINWLDFKDAKVVIKGCSKVDVPVAIYIEAVNQLKPFVNSLMFGEPCSTVPLFKKAKS